MGPDTAGGILGGEGAMAFALLPPDRELVSRSREGVEVERRLQVEGARNGSRGIQDRKVRKTDIMGRQILG